MLYLPRYVFSFKYKAPKKVTMTVERGLKSAEKTGPFRETHQACRKKKTANWSPEYTQHESFNEESSFQECKSVLPKARAMRKEAMVAIKQVQEVVYK